MVSPLKLSLRNLSQKDIVAPSSSSESMQGKYYKLGLHRISGRPDIRPFFISGIRSDIRFRLPDIRLEKTVLN